MVTSELVFGGSPASGLVWPIMKMSLSRYGLGFGVGWMWTGGVSPNSLDAVS